MANQLVFLVILAVIAAAAAVPIDKEQTPVVDDHDSDKTAVDVQHEDKTAGEDDKDSSAESDEIADRHFVYPVYYPGYGPYYVQPSYVQPRPTYLVQPGYVPIQPGHVYPGYVPVQPGFVYPTYVRPGYAHSSVYVQYG